MAKVMSEIRDVVMEKKVEILECLTAAVVIFSLL